MKSSFFCNGLTHYGTMIHGSAIHIAYRILAAFFIDMGAKTSIVENLVFIQPLFYLYYFFIRSNN